MFNLNKKQSLNPAEEQERLAKGLSVEQYKKQQKRKAKENERKASLAKAQESRDSNQNYGDKAAEITELSSDNSPEAKERIETLKSQQNEIVNDLTDGQKTDLQNDIDNGNITNAANAANAENVVSNQPQEAPEPQKPAPNIPPKTEQQAIAIEANKPEVQEQAASTAAQRFAERMGISEQEAQDYLSAFVKGKMPPGSKGYFIGNAIATAAQNIANQLAASEYNNRWSSIQSGAYMQPEMQQSEWQKYKNDSLSKLQDIQAQMAKENLTEEGKNQVQQGKLQNKILNSEAIMRNIDALGYQDKQDLEMEMKRAGLDQQKLTNELLKFNAMNEAEKSKYYAQLAEMDAATARATLNSLKYGGANLSVKVPGVSGSIDLATVANMGGDLKAMLRKAGI